MSGGEEGISGDLRKRWEGGGKSRGKFFSPTWSRSSFTAAEWTYRAEEGFFSLLLLLLLLLSFFYFPLAVQFFFSLRRLVSDSFDGGKGAKRRRLGLKGRDGCWVFLFLGVGGKRELLSKAKAEFSQRAKRC